MVFMPANQQRDIGYLPFTGENALGGVLCINPAGNYGNGANRSTLSLVLLHSPYTVTTPAHTSLPYLHLKKRKVGQVHSFEQEFDSNPGCDDPRRELKPLSHSRLVGIDRQTLGGKVFFFSPPRTRNWMDGYAANLTRGYSKITALDAGTTREQLMDIIFKELAKHIRFSGRDWRELESLISDWGHYLPRILPALYNINVPSEGAEDRVFGEFAD